jgi:hypothetical protein
MRVKRRSQGQGGIRRGETRERGRDPISWTDYVRRFHPTSSIFDDDRWREDALLPDGAIGEIRRSTVLGLVADASAPEMR